jgi:hypothetical protein
MPTAATSDTPATCAPLDPDGAEEGGDLVGVALGRYCPAGLSLSPDPGRSIAMQLKCSVYAGSWNA